MGIDSQWGLDSSFTGWDSTGDGDFADVGESPPFKNAVTTLFAGTLQTGEHGVQPLATPSIGSILSYEPSAKGDYVPGRPRVLTSTVAPGTGTHSKGFFHKNADLVIIGNQVYNKAGANITSLMPSGFITSQNLWDQRQGRTLTCTKINIGKLGDMDGSAATKDPCPYYPANGLLYVARTDTTSSQPNGVVLTNGAEINIPDKWNSSNYRGIDPDLLGVAAGRGVRIRAEPAPGADGRLALSRLRAWKLQHQVEEARRRHHRRHQPSELGLGLLEDIRSDQDGGQHHLQPRDDHRQHEHDARTLQRRVRKPAAFPRELVGQELHDHGLVREHVALAIRYRAMGVRRRLVQRAESCVVVRHDFRSRIIAAIHTN